MAVTECMPLMTDDRLAITGCMQPMTGEQGASH